MRHIICVIIGCFLISCSGTGTKNFSTINAMMMDSTEKVFVGREKGYFNSAVIYTIILNGKHLGTLGNGETLVGDFVKGNNFLKTNAIIGGPMVSFVGKTNSNNYFILSYQKSLFLVS